MTLNSRASRQAEKCAGGIREGLFRELEERGYELLSSGTENGARTLVYRSHTESAACPCCGRVSSSVHGYGARTVMALPGDRVPSYAEIHKRRFRCCNPECPRKTFGEEVPYAPPYAERTAAVDAEMAYQSSRTSFRDACVFLSVSGTPVSVNTLRRIYDRIEVPDPGDEVVRVGVDDVALRRGQVYCTVMYDMDGGGLIRLFPGRSDGSVTEWLRAHPNVRVIARDRLRSYGRMIDLAAGDGVITQVADRFHLLSNASDVLKRIFMADMPGDIIVSGGHVVCSGARDTEKSFSVPQGTCFFKPMRIFCHITTRKEKKRRMRQYLELEEYMPLLEEAFPSIGYVKGIYTEFYDALMGGDPGRMDAFIETHETDDRLKKFCRSLKRDIAPIHNAISLDTSSGPVEGNNNKLLYA